MRSKLIGAILVLPIYLAALDNNFSIWTPKIVVVEQSAESADFNETRGEFDKNIFDPYLKSMKKYYPASSEIFDRQKIDQTFAAYLQVNRVAKYQVQMVGSQVKSYFLPVTASINFVNMSNGDILFSDTFTEIAQIDLAASDPMTKTKLISLYQQTYATLFERLAKDASEKFQPKQIDCKVIGKYKGISILDKGLSGGIAKGDSLNRVGGEGLVLYSTQEYSIVKDDFSEPSINDIYSKQYNGSLNKKPKITLLDITMDKNRTDQPASEMLYQVFSDTLASKANFSLVSTSRSYYEAKRAIEAKAGVKVLEGKRQIPEYFMRLFFDGPTMYEFPTNVDYAHYNVFNVRACGEIIDLSGRVLYSSCKSEDINDQIVLGKGFSIPARNEIAMKNATIALAEEFSSSIKFDQISYDIKSVDNDSIKVNDDKNLLAEGSVITVYKNIGNIGSFNDVYIPLQEAVVNSKSGNDIVAKLDSITQLIKEENIKSGNKIFEDLITSGKLNKSSKLVSICALTSKVDGETIDNFDNIARFLIKKNFQYPLYDTNGLKEALERELDSSKFVTTPVLTTPKDISYCINPVYIFNIEAETDGNIPTVKNTKTEIDGGIRIYKTGVQDPIVEEALSLTPTLQVPQGFKNEYLHIESLKAALQDLEKSLVDINIP
jgi:hypothetical protein